MILLCIPLLFVSCTDKKKTEHPNPDMTHDSPNMALDPFQDAHGAPYKAGSGPRPIEHGKPPASQIDNQPLYELIQIVNDARRSLSEDIDSNEKILLDDLDRRTSDETTDLLFKLLDLSKNVEHSTREKIKQKALAIFQNTLADVPRNVPARLAVFILTNDMKEEESIQTACREFSGYYIHRDVTQGEPTGCENPYLYFARLLETMQSGTCWEAGIVLAQKAAVLDKSNPWSYIYMAQLYYHLDENENSLKAATRAVVLAEKTRIDDIIMESKHNKALALQELGRLEQAEQLWKDVKFKKSGELWACAYQALGELYSQMGKPTEKAMSLMEMSDFYSQSSVAAFTAARYCFWAGDYKNADKYIDRAMVIEPNGAHKQLKGHLWLIKNEYKKAESVFKELKKGPFVSEAEVGFGHLAIIKKDYSRASELLKPFAGLHTETIAFENKMAAIGMAWILSNQNKHRQGLEYVEKLVNNDPSNILALLAKGNALVGLNQLEAGEKIYHQILNMQPDNPYAMAELGIVLYKLGKDGEAEKALQKSISLHTGVYTCPYEGLGLLYLKQGKIEKAKTKLEKAIELNPDIEYKKYNALAKIHLQEGQKKKAGELLEKSIENFPYNNEARQLLEQIRTDDVE